MQNSSWPPHTGEGVGAGMCWARGVASAEHKTGTNLLKRSESKVSCFTNTQPIIKMF